MSVVGGLQGMGHDIVDVASSAGHAGVEFVEGMGDAVASLGHSFVAAGDAFVNDWDGAVHHGRASCADIDQRDAHFHRAKDYLMGSGGALAGGDGSSAGDGSFGAVSSYGGDGSYYTADCATSDDGEGSDTADGSYGYDISGDDYSRVDGCGAADCSAEGDSGGDE